MIQFLSLNICSLCSIGNRIQAYEICKSLYSLIYVLHNVPIFLEMGLQQSASLLQTVEWPDPFSCISCRLTNQSLMSSVMFKQTNSDNWSESTEVITLRYSSCFYHTKPAYFVAPNPKSLLQFDVDAEH